MRLPWVLPLLALPWLPGAWGGCHASPWLRADEDAQVALGDGVAAHVDGLSPDAFGTGHALFDHEWWFGTHMMAAVGHAQVALAHPELREERLAAMEACLDPLLTEEGQRFDTMRWGVAPLDDLGSSRDHAAYYGYLLLPLALHGLLDPDSRYAPLADAIARHLEDRWPRTEVGLLATYPGEAYPVDNALALTGLAVHERASGADHGATIDAVIATFRRDYVVDGLLIQAVAPDGSWKTGPRGSGTAFASWALSYVDDDLSAELWEGARAHLYRDALGFAALREYPVGAPGLGDIDSGPIVLGLGVSASGFALGAALAHDDRQAFRRLYASAWLFGAPTRSGFALGGPIGDAILYALLTTRPEAS